LSGQIAVSRIVPQKQDDVDDVCHNNYPVAGHEFWHALFMENWVTQAIGIAAGVCTAVSLIPQIIKILKEKKAQDISMLYLVVLLVGLILWIVYGVLRKDIPVIATNVTSVVINVVTIFLGMKYKKKS
jgi:MtN3 and saliva related transmembrane protein